MIIITPHLWADLHCVTMTITAMTTKNENIDAMPTWAYLSIYSAVLYALVLAWASLSDMVGVSVTWWWCARCCGSVKGVVVVWVWYCGGVRCVLMVLRCRSGVSGVVVVWVWHCCGVRGVVVVLKVLPWCCGGVKGVAVVLWWCERCCGGVKVERWWCPNDMNGFSTFQVLINYPN